MSLPFAFFRLPIQALQQELYDARVAVAQAEKRAGTNKQMAEAEIVALTNEIERIRTEGVKAGHDLANAKADLAGVWVDHCAYVMMTSPFALWASDIPILNIIMYR